MMNYQLYAPLAMFFPLFVKLMFVIPILSSCISSNNNVTFFAVRSNTLMSLIQNVENLNRIVSQ